MGGTSALRVIQNAVYAVLNANATLTGKVFDEPVQNRALPYVEIGEATEIPFNTMGAKYGKEVAFSVTVHSSYAGMKEAQELHEAVMPLLDRATLTVSGYENPVIRFQQAQAFKDGNLRRLESSYTFTLQES